MVEAAEVVVVGARAVPTTTIQGTAGRVAGVATMDQIVVDPRIGPKVGLFIEINYFALGIFNEQVFASYTTGNARGDDRSRSRDNTRGKLATKCLNREVLALTYLVH